MTDNNSFFAGDQILGVRDSQQDDFAVHDLSTTKQSSEKIMLMLADGMGGHLGGEVASATVLESFADSYIQLKGDIASKLQDSLGEATKSIAHAVKDDVSLRKMGTTLIVVIVLENKIQWLSVGDSPLWLFRKGELIRLNEDHSMVTLLQNMVEIGRMTEDELAVAPNRHVLRSIVNAEQSKIVDLCETPYSLEDDDLLLLASDGIETLSEDEIISILTQYKNESLETITAELLNAVTKFNKKKQDNATVVLYRKSFNKSVSQKQKVAVAPNPGPFMTMLQKLFLILIICGATAVTGFYIGKGKDVEVKITVPVPTQHTEVALEELGTREQPIANKKPPIESEESLATKNQPVSEPIPIEPQVDVVIAADQTAESQVIPDVHPSPVSSQVDDISSLLKLCSKYYDAKQFVRLGGENATSCYSKVLELDHTNTIAKDRMANIITEYLDLAGAALATGDVNKANLYLDDLKTIEGSGLAVEGLTEAIAKVEKDSSSLNQ